MGQVCCSDSQTGAIVQLTEDLGEVDKSHKTAGSYSAFDSGTISQEQVTPDDIKVFHSSLRWGKPWEEIETKSRVSRRPSLCFENDADNGNAAIHIAAQNGHFEHVQRLVAEGAPVNAQNKKGQTALHMSVEYKTYFLSKFLLDNGADGQLQNVDGHQAITGLEGRMLGDQAWDNPVNMLRDVATREDLEVAFAALAKALSSPELISKEKLIQTGLLMKKYEKVKQIWDHQRFMALAAKF